MSSQENFFFSKLTDNLGTWPQKGSPSLVYTESASTGRSPKQITRLKDGGGEAYSLSSDRSAVVMQARYTETVSAVQGQNCVRPKMFRRAEENCGYVKLTKTI